MKNIALIVGGLVLIAVVIAAAYIAGRMMMAPAETAADSAGASGGRVMELVRDDGNGAVGVRVSIEPASELPDEPAEISGIFVRREDDSIFVGTGDIELSVEVDKNTGQRSVATDHSGPVVEVVTTQETAIYKDITNIEIEPSAQQSGEQKIQQVVQPDSSLAEVDENTELQVWGERRGDRVVAELVVYRPVGE
jgi:hypothetical protein